MKRTCNTNTNVLRYNWQAVHGKHQQTATIYFSAAMEPCAMARWRAGAAATTRAREHDVPSTRRTCVPHQMSVQEDKITAVHRTVRKAIDHVQVSVVGCRSTWYWCVHRWKDGWVHPGPHVAMSMSRQSGGYLGATYMRRWVPDANASWCCSEAPTVRCCCSGKVWCCSVVLVRTLWHCSVPNVKLL